MDKQQIKDLAAFLRTRLDEDEAAAKEADRAAGWQAVGDPWNQHPRTDVSRMLREVEAKRAILGWADSPALPDYERDYVLVALAAVYRDHPDYGQLKE